MFLPSATYRQLAKARIFIDRNYREPLDLHAIARIACISPYHFHRLFTRTYRYTPHAYLTFKRIEQAKLLLEQNRPVMEVCSEVGFESPGSFSMLFKRETGYTPQCYRANSQRKKQKALEQPRTVIPHCFIVQHGLDR
jgi:AraC-like DNA-binding protein